MGASGASRQKLSTNSRRKSGTRRAKHGDQPTAADRRPDAIPHRMARLLRLLPDPTRAHEPGSVDPPKITLVSLAAVAERAQSLQRTAPSWRAKVPCSGRRRFTDGVLAHVRTPGGPTSSAQPLFRLTRPPPTPCRCPSLTRSNRRGTDPYARWWGRGGTARCPPIPIIGASRPLPRVRAKVPLLNRERALSLGHGNASSC